MASLIIEQVRKQSVVEQLTIEQVELSGSQDHDGWDRFVTFEASEAIGRWLIESGRVNVPVAKLTRADLENIATQAISRFIVLTSEAIARKQPIPEFLNPLWGA